MFVAVGLEKVIVVRGVIVMVVKAEVEKPEEGMSVCVPEPASARLLLTRPIGVKVE